MVRPSTQPSSRRRAAKAPAHGAKPEALAPRNPIVGSLPVCCADVLMGHVAVALTISVMNSRRLIAAPEALRGHRTDLLFSLEGVDDRGDVRFRSQADICGATSDVCYYPNSDRESRHPQTIMSALPPKADMCSAQAHVCFGPIADTAMERLRKV